MKKVIALLLVFVFVFSFASCKKEEDDNPALTTSEISYNLDNLLKDGEIPGVPYKLGTSVQKIKDDAGYKPEDELNDDDEFSIIENTKYTRMAYLTSYYCFAPDKEENGISSIVDFGTPFDFETGTTTPDDVKAYFKDVEFEERELTSSQVYFIPMQMENCTALTYEKDNRRIDFIFESDLLIAINLVDTDNWGIEK